MTLSGISRGSFFYSEKLIYPSPACVLCGIPILSVIATRGLAKASAAAYRNCTAATNYIKALFKKQGFDNLSGNL
jgi:hypothetical protein